MTDWYTMPCDCCVKREASYYLDKKGRRQQGPITNFLVRKIRCDDCRAKCKGQATCRL